MASHQKAALQSNMWETMTPEINPTTNPSGLPALKHAKTAFFRLDGTSYIAASIPWAGGTAAAEVRPINPLTTSKAIPDFANPAARANTEYMNKLRMNIRLLPKRSAIRAKSNRNDPDARADAPDSHVISGFDMLRSRPMNEELTVTIPAVMELIPTAIVAMSTTSISWKVDEKHSGLPPGSWKLGELGASTGLIANSLLFSGSSIGLARRVRSGDPLTGP